MRSIESEICLIKNPSSKLYYPDRHDMEPLEHGRYKGQTPSKNYVQSRQIKAVVY